MPPRSPEERFAYYWKNAERIRERNRVYGYERRGLPVPEKRVYRLRTFEEREAAKKAVRKLRERRKPEPKPVPPPVKEEVSFVLSNKDFQ